MHGAMRKVFPGRATAMEIEHSLQVRELK
jgi:hypothetical protein